MLIKKLRMATAALGALLVLPLAGQAWAQSASPQVLALVSLQKPMELLCFNGDCFVELSAFCLQPDYKTPDADTAYQLLGTGGIRVTGHTKDGATISLDPNKHFEITALRTHVAVKMSMRAYDLHKMNLDRVTVSVETDVSLVPAPSEESPPSPLRPGRERDRPRSSWCR